MSTVIPIEHPGRLRRGIVLRRGGRLGEASPLPGRSSERVEDVLRAVTLGGPVPPSLDFARWALDTPLAATVVRSQVLLEDPRSAIEHALRALRGGAHAFKLKIRSADDAAVVTELRRLAPDAVLRVDANRAFASEGLIPWDALARARVEWIEEPCPGAGSLVGTPVELALDESVALAPDASLEDVADGRVRTLVLKPTLLGASSTLEIARRCLALGGRAIVSHAFESEVGRRAGEELARRIAPGEIHGLHRWPEIDAYRLSASGAPVASLEESSGAHPALV